MWLAVTVLESKTWNISSPQKVLWGRVALLLTLMSVLFAVLSPPSRRVPSVLQVLNILETWGARALGLLPSCCVTLDMLLHLSGPLPPSVKGLVSSLRSLSALVNYG